MEPSMNVTSSSAAVALRRFASSSPSAGGSQPTKRLFLLRHGQATHNPRAEAARHSGCSYERFLQLMKEDDEFDAPLTELGEVQARRAAELCGDRLARNVDLVVSSPLSRALRTADLALPPPTSSSTYSSVHPSFVRRTQQQHHDGVATDGGRTLSTSAESGGGSRLRNLHPRRVCVEHFREINGWLLNAKRRDRTNLEQLFHPHWDFSLLSPSDDTWTETLESQEACGERGYQGLLWLAKRPEENILVVSHGGLLRFAMVDHPNVKLTDGRQRTQMNGDDDEGNSWREVEKRFGNGELREFIMTWDDVDEERGRRDFTNREPDVLANGDGDACRRPIITLTEVSAEEEEEPQELSQTG